MNARERRADKTWERDALKGGRGRSLVDWADSGLFPGRALVSGCDLFRRRLENPPVVQF